jgi:heme A synthase
VIGRRTLIELLHIAAGVIASAVIAWGAVWSLPHAAGTIWAVMGGVMVVVVFMGIRPLRMAWRADRRRDGAASSE